MRRRASKNFGPRGWASRPNPNPPSQSLALAAHSLLARCDLKVRDLNVVAALCTRQVAQIGALKRLNFLVQLLRFSEARAY